MPISANHRPPFRADNNGSLLRLAVLIEAFRQFAANKIDEAEFRKVQDDAIRDVVKLQQEVGFASPPTANFAARRGPVLLRSPTASSSRKRSSNSTTIMAMRPNAPHVVGRLKRRQPISMEEFSFVKPLTGAVPKITMPSPSTMHYWRVGNWQEPGVYQDATEMFVDLGKVYQQEIAELAAAGCQYVQLDEVALANLCDPASREHARALGADPEALVDLYVEAINQALKNRPANMVVGIHMCRGNFKGKYLSEGGYDSVAEKLFNGANVNHFLLEYDTPRAGGFAPLRFLPKTKGAVLGMVSSKTPQLESIDALRRRADEAAKHVDPARLALSPQCGFASTVAGNPVTEADERAKLRLCVEAAQAIWD
jgi:5-methyltetrahydropteroyltriglutamate--homocysteine methyltransferase